MAETMTAPTLDLAPLYRRCVFRSAARAATHAEVARELSGHDLSWRQGAPDTALFKTQARHLQLFALKYGAEVEVMSRPFDDFALVHLLLRGSAEFDVDHQRLDLRPGAVAVLAPLRHARLRCSAGAERLILKLPGALLRELGRPAALAPVAQLAPAHQPQWALMMQQLLLLDPEAGLQPDWVRHLEHNIALFLLTHQRSAPGLEANTDAQRLARVQRHVLAHLAAPLALADLARAAGLSPRALNLLCQRVHGLPPMSWLRALRLQAAHARLQAEPWLPVTQVALDCGFGHLGRFSAYFRQRYGCLPGKKLRPARPAASDSMR